MSLLMKALEKAAKDRGEAREMPAPASSEPRPEVSLALELLAADTPSPRMREDARPDRSPAQPPSMPGYRGDAARTNQSVRAGTESQRATAAYLRDHPVMVFGFLAGFFALAFGAYVYVQIFHPGLLLRNKPAPPAPPPPVVETPAVTPAAQSISTAALLNAAPAALPQASAPVSLVQLPLAAQAVKETETLATPPKPVVVKPAAKPETPQPRNTIVVKRGDAGPSINPTLANAYASLQAGRLESAAQLYGQLLRSEPKSADALLGLAAIAVREGRNDDAAAHYRAILEIDPRHAVAQSGLIALTGRAEPVAAESHLKQLIAREPSAFLYFTLGNLYADQSLWAPAQQAYFQAHHLEPDNPDYAYNLAVGLEHISQSRLALGFYRRAVELSAARPQVHFDPARARERINVLAAQVQ
jgi:tetratricopeptide (TPR) repeat protein